MGICCSRRGQRGNCSVAADLMEGIEDTTEGKENDGGHAAAGEPGAADPKATVAVLIMKADLMFPEGHGAPRRSKPGTPLFMFPRTSNP